MNPGGTEPHPGRYRKGREMTTVHTPDGKTVQYFIGEGIGLACFRQTSSPCAFQWPEEAWPRRPIARQEPSGWNQ